MTAEQRLALILRTAKYRGLTHLDLTHLTGHSLNTVSSWFTNCTSARHRNVSARAIDRLLLELATGHVKGNKPTRG